MPSQVFRFPNQAGETLAGRLERPEGGLRAVAIFAHCFTCSKDNSAAFRIARALRDRGIAVLRFDFTGLGDSEGEFANTNFSSNVEDLLAAAAHLRNTLEAPRILIGHSLGGAAVLAAASRLPAVELVASINAPADVRHVSGLFGEGLADIEADGAARVNLAGREFRLTRQFLEDIREENLLKDKIAAYRGALLVLHAPEDDTVAVDHAGRIFSAGRHPKSFIALPAAGHMLDRREDCDYVGALIALWAERYLAG